MKRLRAIGRKLSTPEVQMTAALTICAFSTMLVLSVFARFLPAPLDRLAIGRHEPFWVLLLSVLALLFAGFTSIPAALAYREVKAQNDT